MFSESVVVEMTRRLRHFDNRVPRMYLLGVVVRYSWMLIRSVRYLFYKNLRPFQCFIGRNVSLACKSNIKFGSSVRLEDCVRIDGLGRFGVTLGERVKIGAYSQLICSGSLSNIGEYIRVGSGVGIGEFARIGGSGGVSIGEDTIIGQYFSAHPENHNFNSCSLLIREQGTTRAPISVGRNCWIGAKVTILAGVEVGDGSVIAAGSVLTKSFGPNSIVAGVPAKLIRVRV